MNFLYQPHWCEENIWHLAADPRVGAGERYVLLLTGTSGEFACWNQRAAGPPGRCVLWDYHVVLAVHRRSWEILDLDTHLPCPTSAADWLDGTFPFDNKHLMPGIRVRALMIPAAEWRRDLWTDRGHMRTASGGWQKPPPPWDPPQGSGVTLARYLDEARGALTLLELRSRLSAPESANCSG